MLHTVIRHVLLDTCGVRFLGHVFKTTAIEYGTTIIRSGGWRDLLCPAAPAPSGSGVPV